MRSILIAAVLLAALCVLNRTHGPAGTAWVHPPEKGSGPARILRFYASAGAVEPGQQVQLCYAVENARSVRISPLFTSLYPLRNFCLEVAPQHTTHFTLLAEGYDGSVAARSFTLPVQIAPPTLSVRSLWVAGM
jgi:hypothetical protein